MERCLLCLEINKDFVECIKVDSTQWQEQNIKELIEKHLWIMESILPSSWICLNCWQILHDFHKFYMRIEEAHVDFAKLVETKSNNFNYVKATDIFESHQEPEIFIDQLSMDDCKPIKEELDQEFDEDDVPLLQRCKRTVFTKDILINAEEANQDPLKKSNRKKSAKDKKNKRVPKAPKLKHDFDSLPDKSIMSSDCDDIDTKTDLDCKPQEEADRPKRTIKKTTTNELNFSDSDGSNTDFEYKPEEDGGNKLPKLTYKQKDLFITENYKMSCILCKIPIENFRSLLKHFKDEHEVRGYAVCCNKKFYERGKLLKHIYCHGESDYFGFKTEDDDNNKQPKPSYKEKDQFLTENFKITCVLCEIPMENFRTLLKHFEMEHKERGYAVCCKRKFYERGKLIDHVHQHVEPDNLKCNECGRVLSCRKSLQNHQLVHLSDEEKKVNCTECGKCFADQNLLLKHVNSVHLRKYAKICDICGKRLRCGEPFQRHMLEHEGKPLPTISCDVCGLQVSTKHGLRRHKSIRHPVGGKQTQTCPVCFKISPNLRAQREHIRRVHSANNSHVCSMCGRGFKRPLALKEHMATHTGIALYTCPWCPKTFNANGGLHAHRKRQHPIEWEQAQREKMQRYSIPPITEIKKSDFS